MNSTFADRLRDLIGNESVAAFARKCEIGDSLMRSYLAGSDPGRQNVEKIWRGSGCSLFWLMTGEGPMYLASGDAVPSSAPYRIKRGRELGVAEGGAQEHGPEVLESRDGREFILVPQYDVRVSAGGGSVIHSEQIVDHLSFQTDWFARWVGIPPVSAAVVEVRGESMRPDLEDEDLVIIDITKNAFVDDAIYVLQYGDALRIKKVTVKIDGTVEIKSSNEAAGYKPEVLTPEEAQQITVVGRSKRAIRTWRLS